MVRPLGAGVRDGKIRSPADPLADVVPLVSTDHIGASTGEGVPAFWNTFIGRDRELDDLTALLKSTRLVTLTGVGGIGKTRLAVEVAERVRERAVFVDLAPMREAALVADEIAAAFGVGDLRGRSLAQVLPGEWTDATLLVLDNCEHLLAACADLSLRLLKASRNLRILATSRQCLGISGEVVWPVPPLALPEAGLAPVAEDALRSAAVELFCDRAAAAQRGFAVSTANVGAVVEICRQLDGIPLAIELAAARVAALSPTDIACRLERRFELLRGGPGTAPTRHQTLTAALDWSHELLDEPERLLLRRLSVFAGGFDLQAAEEVCSGEGVERAEVVDLLAALVAKSLVAAETTGVTARYRLLETVRHYANDVLVEAGEAAAATERHLRWCLDLVATAAATEEGAGLEVMGTEQDNVRAALERCVRQGRGESALRLTALQMRFWQGKGHFAEAAEWLGRVLAASGDAPAALRAAALHDYGFATFMLGDFDGARRLVLASLELWAGTGDSASEERTRGLLGFISTFGGGSRVEDLERNLEEVRATGSDARLAEALVGCAHARLFRGEAAAAHRHFAELLAVARHTGDNAMAATALVGLGAAALGLGDYGRAEEHLGEGVEVASLSGQTHAQVVGMGWLGELALVRGDVAEADARFGAALAEARALGAPYPLAKALVGLGRVALAEGRGEAAEVLLDEAAAVGRHGGLGHVVAWATDASGEVALVADDLASARSRFEGALAVAEQCGERTVAARATCHLGEVARARGALAHAASLCRDALIRYDEIADRAGVSEALEALAGVSVERGSTEYAARLFGAAQFIREQVGCGRVPRGQAAYDRDVAALAAAVGHAEFEQGWAQGVGLGYEEAVAYATRTGGRRDRPGTGPDSLTPTESEIVGLVAHGLSNPEIGERLFISPRTVQSHLRKVYGKLQVTSRRELRKAVAEEG
jgi:predicted ATPase/DNA-binding CsgD family transcriptional regulator